VAGSSSTFVLVTTLLGAGVGLLGCSHTETNTASDPTPTTIAEDKVRADLGADPFAETDAGPALGGSFDAGASLSPQASLVAAGPVDSLGTQPPTSPASTGGALTADPPKSTRDQDDAAIKSALAAAAKADPATCGGQLVAAEHEHPDASPALRQQLFTTIARCEEKAKVLPKARWAAMKLLASCGPEVVDRCRSKAIALLRRLASAAPKDAALVESLGTLTKADACLNKLEASSATKLDPCSHEADSAYRHFEDKLMLSRLRLAEAREAVRAKDPNVEHAFGRALQACTEARCAKQRSKIFDAEANYFTTQKKFEEAATARLQQNQLQAETVPADKRRYTRSRALDQACNKLDEDKGAGSCRALELKVTGAWTFHDWSAKNEGGLGKERILQVNDEFAVTLQDCFHEQALRLPVPSTATYQLSWMIGNDGHVAQVHVMPHDNDDGPLAVCLRDRFSVWRYPRYEGENQHVDQNFTVTAKAR
jgi:hypothetical protein